MPVDDRGTPDGRGRWSLVLVLAATLGLAAGVPWLLQRASGFRWLPPGNELVDPRGVSDARLLEGLDAYARHDARAAEHQLANARAGGREESVRRLFLASAVLARGDERRAAALIESVDLQRDLPEPWRAEGLRTLALAWRRSGRVAQADSLASLLEATGSGEKR